jgi:Helix-turn-helix domain
MEKIKNILQKHTIVVLNESIKHGFTQLPNYILKDKRLSFGARLAYAVLLSYAWQEESCFPGQERMAQDLGTSDRSIRTFLTELKDCGYISWKQQGLNKPNVYYILDYKPLELEAERKPPSGQERKQAFLLERKHTSD